MTYRERREARAAKLASWGQKRREKATALLAVDEDKRHDWQFITQPGIARLTVFKRMQASEEKAHGLLSTGAAMQSRAAGITEQLDRAIYSDDDDAIEQLQARIAGQEAKQASAKAFNAAVRKAKGDTALITAAIREHLDESQAAEFMSVMRLQPYHKPELRGLPAYALSNLGADIRRNKERLEKLQREAVEGEAPRYLSSLRRAGVCRTCGATLEQGASALWFRKAGEVACYPKCEATA